MADVTKLKQISVDRRWKALIQSEGKDKTGKNVDMVNVTNRRLCCRYFNKVNLSTDEVVIIPTLPGISGGSY